MNKLIYCLSNHFDYAKLICDDAGPSYASQQQWTTGKIATEFSVDSILIIDNRIGERDFADLQNIIANSNNTLVFKVVDGMFEAMEKDNVKFLFTIPVKKNIFFYSPYAQSWVLTELKKKHGEHKVFTIPYAYDTRREKHQEKRKSKIVVSGSLAGETYPLRWKFHINTYHKLWALNKVKYLQHPGYADIGFKLNHKIFGDAYINFLSRYKFMLVTPSKWDYELLKYRECAYAGCVLVGALPSSINLEGLPGIINMNTDIKTFVKGIVQGDTVMLDESVQNFRNWFRKHRDPDVLNACFINNVANG